MKKRATRKPGIGQLMIQGAKEALAHKRGQLRNVRVTRAAVTVRVVDVVPPREYRKGDVQ